MTKLVLEICGGEVSEVVSAGSLIYKKKNILIKQQSDGLLLVGIQEMACLVLQLKQGQLQFVRR